MRAAAGDVPGVRQRSWRPGDEIDRRARCVGSARRVRCAGPALRTRPHAARFWHLAPVLPGLQSDPMATRWFQFASGRILFAGSITRAPVDQWLRHGEGAALVATVQHEVRFALLGRERAARRRIWKLLAAAASDLSVRHAIQLEADRYLERLATLACLDALPHLHVDLHRLVAVPRALVDNSVFPSLVARLEEQPRIAALDRNLRLFFAARLVSDMDGALARAQPRVHRPVPTWEQWASVGLNADVAWTLPFTAAGPERNGHFHVFEMPRTGIGRRTRKRIAAAIAELDSLIAALSRAQRVEIVGRVGISGC